MGEPGGQLQLLSSNAEVQPSSVLVGIGQVLLYKKLLFSSLPKAFYAAKRSGFCTFGFHPPFPCAVPSLQSLPAAVPVLPQDACSTAEPRSHRIVVLLWHKSVCCRSRTLRTAGSPVRRNREV